VREHPADGDSSRQARDLAPGARSGCTDSTDRLIEALGDRLLAVEDAGSDRGLRRSWSGRAVQDGDRKDRPDA